MATPNDASAAPEGRSLSRLGALVFVALFATLMGGIWYGQRWLESRSDEWALETARRTLQDAHLGDGERAGLLSELARLEAAYRADELAYDGFFACVQRIVEGTLIPAAEAQRFAADLAGLPGEVAYQRLARALRAEVFAPPEAVAFLARLRTTGAPADDGTAVEPEDPAALADEATAIADLSDVPVEPWSFDPAADFRALVDGALAGSPPTKLPLR